MKKNCVYILVFLLLGFTACSDDEDKGYSKDDIAGKWVAYSMKAPGDTGWTEDIGTDYTWVNFSVLGTYTARLAGSSQMGGSYSINGSTVECNYVGSVFKLQIVSLSNNQAHFKYSDVNNRDSFEFKANIN